jgi:hypothetical protein
MTDLDVPLLYFGHDISYTYYNKNIQIVGADSGKAFSTYGSKSVQSVKSHKFDLSFAMNFNEILIPVS